MGPREEDEKNERNRSDNGLETYREEGGRKENKQRGKIKKRNQEKYRETSINTSLKA